MAVLSIEKDQDLMPESTDVVVIGAGPSGLISAKAIAKRGLQVTVLEEHPEVGLPSHCAGLVSVDGLSLIGIEPNSCFIQNRVKTARFHSPSNLTFEVKARRDMAYVIDRSKFDQYLAREAVEKGVELILGRSAKTLNRSEGVIRGIVDDLESILEASITIDAEGVGGRLLAKSGLKPVDEKHILPAFQYELFDVEVEEESVDLFFGRRYAPNFFAWIIPTGSDSARVGLASNEGNIRQLLDKFVDDNFHTSTKVEKRTGLIITGGPIPKTCLHGFIAVGDVAGQTKPTTGGGVVTGGICASVAARSAVSAVEKHDASLEFLSDSYEVEWRKLLANEFSTMIIARRIYNMLSDSTLDELFKVVLKENLTDEIEASGDMDFQASILLKLAKKPSVIRILPMVVGDLVKALLP